VDAIHVIRFYFAKKCWGLYFGDLCAVNSDCLYRHIDGKGIYSRLQGGSLGANLCNLPCAIYFIIAICAVQGTMETDRTAVIGVELQRWWPQYQFIVSAVMMSEVRSLDDYLARSSCSPLGL
jgi:hypothetical protein